MLTIKNQRFWSIFLVCFLAGAGVPLFAQESGEQERETEEPWEDEEGSGGDTEPGDGIGMEEWEGPEPALYQRGDKTFIITLGTIVPTYFSGEIGEKGHNLSPAGGTGSLAFNVFVSSHIFLGAELGGMFIGTKGDNMLFIVPFGVRFGWQFVFRRFEFPITLMVGGAPQKYLEKGYFGFILKPGASVFWRFNPDWSFGLNANWWFVPQTPKNGKNVMANFMEITLSARYHF